MFLMVVYLMNKPIKAALLSALVFPGVGHFYLKKHMAGTILAGASIVVLCFVTFKIVARALQITEIITRGDVDLDITSITELMSKQPTGTGAQFFSFASAVLIILWLIGIVDSYRVGRAQGKASGT
jgi:hypothetical protein